MNIYSIYMHIYLSVSARDKLYISFENQRKNSFGKQHEYYLFVGEIALSIRRVEHVSAVSQQEMLTTYRYAI